MDPFEDFLLDAGPRLLRLARVLARDAGTAEDLVQASLAVLWARRRTVDPAAWEAYARRVLVRRASAWYARRFTSEVALDDVPERWTDTDRAALVDLRTALAGLSARERAVLVLRFLEDVPVDETAALLGCSADAVTTATRRGLDRLRATATTLLEGYA